MYDFKSLSRSRYDFRHVVPEKALSFGYSPKIKEVDS